MKRIIVMLTLMAVVALAASASVFAGSASADNCVGSTVSAANHLLKASGFHGIGNYAHDLGFPNTGNAVIDPFSDSVCGTN